jgi:DNA-binding NarL/FixJ family response regulator
MSTSRSCLVIDARPVVRLGIRSLLAPEFEVEEVPDGGEALRVLTSVGNFDVAIVEMRIAADGGIPSGTATIRKLRSAHPALGVVALGGPPERHAVREALGAGAAAYVSKHSATSSLLDAIRAAADQEGFVDPAARAGARAGLTRRQREVLQMFANGLSTADTARRLGLSEETVRTHAKASLSRIGARDRTHAVALAMRGSLIE